MVTLRVRSMVWFATGVVLAVLATVLVMQTWRVDAAPGDEDSTFVPVTPCRLFDMRPGEAPNDGKKSPLAAGEGNAHVQQVTGSVGNCVGIPADATAVAMNVTIVNPTAQSNLRVYPADVAAPTVSNLNWLPGQSPTPNKVDVKLSGNGKIKLLNHAGTVQVLADVVGYYTNSTLKELAALLAAANANIAALEAAGPFAVTAEELPTSNSAATALTNAPMNYVTVEVTAPVAGQVTVNSFAAVGHTADGKSVGCKILESTEPDGGFVVYEAYFQLFRAAAPVYNGTIAGTRTFNIAAGETRTYGLRCREYANSGYLDSRVLTAIFTPAP